jgi:hypothetical protein
MDLLKTSKSIEEFKNKVRELVANDIESAFDSLKPIVQQNNILYNDWVLQKGRHNDTLKFFNRHIESKADLDMERNKVRLALLSIIDSITQFEYAQMVADIEISDLIKNLENSLETNIEKIKQLESKNEEIRIDQEETNQEVEEQRKQNEEIIRKLINKNEELIKINENLERAKREIEENKTTIHQIESENERIKFDKQKTVEEVETQRKQNELVIQQLNRKNEELTKVTIDWENAKKEVSENKQTIINLRKENEDLYKKTKDISKYEHRLKENDYALLSLKSENLKLNDEVKKLRAYEKVISDNKKTIEDLSRENKAILSEKEKINEELNAFLSEPGRVIKEVTNVIPKWMKYVMLFLSIWFLATASFFYNKYIERDPSGINDLIKNPETTTTETTTETTKPALTNPNKLPIPCFIVTVIARDSISTAKDDVSFLKGVGYPKANFLSLSDYGKPNSKKLQIYIDYYLTFDSANIVRNEFKSNKSRFKDKKNYTEVEVRKLDSNVGL